ncbi:MAG: SIMPL domain-containing protein [Clostridia bacterium]|nr:SIMPL domain-containing protein [Clostridia bacterium]
MKKVIAVFAAIVLMVFLALPVLAENERVIQVSGSGVVSLAADTASIQIGVETRSDNVKDAQQENANLMAAVLEAIKKAGIEEKDVMTSQFNVYSGYDYSSDALGRETRIPYYQVNNNVTVTIHDLTMVGAVLDAAMEAGANTTYGISFSSTQANEAYQKALTRAVEDAMNKAKVLAAAAGVELGELIRMDATQNSGGYFRETYGIANSYAYSAKTADAGTSITGGDLTVTADVVLEYVLK